MHMPGMPRAVKRDSPDTSTTSTIHERPRAETAGECRLSMMAVVQSSIEKRDDGAQRYPISYFNAHARRELASSD